MKAGKLTVKHQVTIPRDVRVALGLKAGDRVMFAIEDGQAVLTKAEMNDAEEEAWFRFTMSQMTEWADPEEDAYWADL